MIVGIPREIKNNEYRVAILPIGVEQLRRQGHEVVIEKDAGFGSGITDKEYQEAGATVVHTTKDVYERSGMIVKIKEPQPSESPFLRPGKFVFTYFHFAASRSLTEAMLERRIHAFAYETLQTPNGELPCLTPMSEVAGRMAVHEGA